MSKYLTIGVIAIVVIVGGWYLFGGTPNTTPTQGVQGQGRAVVIIKDAAASNTVQGATAIVLTVDKLEAQSSASGWVTLSSATKQYDLLQLKQSGAAALLADANLASGTYEQLRLHISKVEVTAGGKVQEAKLPSNTLKIVGNFTVVAGQTTTLSLDFLADKSLHLTGNGKYILAPVIKLEVKDHASVNIGADGKVIVSGGKIETEVSEGMNDAGEMIRVEGETGAPAQVTLNFTAQNNSGLSGTAILSETDGKVRVKLSLNGGSLGTSVVPEPAHIHLGACPNPGAVKYSLNSVVAGTSNTVVNVSWADLKAQLPLAINVHKSAADISTYTACADVKF